nr:MAG TPA: hypothetical protein [Caudoviricetes sp.]
MAGAAGISFDKLITSVAMIQHDSKKWKSKIRK